MSSCIVLTLYVILLQQQFFLFIRYIPIKSRDKMSYLVKVFTILLMKWNAQFCCPYYIQLPLCHPIAELQFGLNFYVTKQCVTKPLQYTMLVSRYVRTKSQLRLDYRVSSKLSPPFIFFRGHLNACLWRVFCSFWT